MCHAPLESSRRQPVEASTRPCLHALLRAMRGTPQVKVFWAQVKVFWTLSGGSWENENDLHMANLVRTDAPPRKRGKQICIEG